ncbi:hypothetical protein PR202_gb10386 [Eleusine coracana subsp. coracana]|uniref:Uncharacterized protein n=1 Tax=Eleusine coracana subsp. coracana TaxID=191504 RepID=A0AAV5EJ62_ELECO|nr:hypothetical protein PR202_gb10386 [Eleusine coracana subsp. coracana]
MEKERKGEMRRGLGMVGGDWVVACVSTLAANKYGRLLSLPCGPAPAPSWGRKAKKETSGDDKSGGGFDRGPGPFWTLRVSWL